MSYEKCRARCNAGTGPGVKKCPRCAGYGVEPGSFAVAAITPEMQNVGGEAANEVCLQLFLAKWNSSDAEQIACVAYRAMRPLEPIPVTPGLWSDDSVRRLIEQHVRDGAEMERLRDEVSTLTRHADAQKELLALSRGLLAAKESRLAAKEARIAELDTELARRPAPVPDMPTAAPNPFREFACDRRRIGG